MRDADQLRQRTKRNLVGVHNALASVVERAGVAPGYQMCVTEGLRDMHRQAKLLKAGKSKTMNSRHLTGHAFDFAMFDPLKDAPDDFVKKVDPAYREQWQLFKEAADAVGTPIEWGGDWAGLGDGTHVQLSWAAYPIQANPKTPGNSKTVAASILGFPVAAYVPEIFESIKSLVGGLTWFDDAFVKYLQLSLVVIIAAFVIWERVQKMRREGV